MINTLSTNKNLVFLEKSIINSNLLKLKTLKSKVDQYFNLTQFVELFEITSQIHDSIGTTQNLSPQELELYQTLFVWGRNMDGYNQTPVGIKPTVSTIFIGGFKKLPLTTIENYIINLVRDIDVIFALKVYYQPVLQEALELIITNLEDLEQQ